MGDHLWQSTLFAVLAAILALTLRKNQARVRYWVWMSASVKFLIPFSLLIAFGSHLARPRVSTPAQVVVYSAVEDFSQPFVGQVIPVTSQAPAAARVSLISMIPAMAVAVWMVGVGFVLFRWTAGWVRISLMVRNGVPVGEGPEIDALRRLELRVGVGRAIRLVRSGDWMEPGIFGIFRPVLIWPEGISEHLDGRHVEAIFAHEVCHARRRDNLTAAVHMLVEAVFWFHPLVWWMGARLEEERERACDEEVGQLCNQPHVYAESILKVCKFCSESPLACVSGITGADLKKRIMQIMTERVARKLDLGRKLLLVTVGLGVVAVPIVLAQAKAAQRMMLAAVDAAPRPFRAAAHAIMPLEETPVLGEIAEVQPPSGADATLGQTQAEARPFTFDVVSIRPAVPPASDGRPRIGYKFTDDGFVANSSLLMTLVFQYLPELQGDSTRIVGGPDWVRTIPWEIRAKVADSDIAEWSKLSDDPSPKAKRRQRATVDAMLAERFKLKTHLESRESAIYALVISKGGPNLKPAKPDARAGFTSGPGRFSSQTVTLGLVAQLLGHELGRPVIDKTGLTGNYNITLNWAPTQGGAGGEAAQAADSAAPSLFTAVQEQLGLKLEAQKGPVEHLVIDSAVKPSVDGAEVQPAAAMAPVAQDAAGQHQTNGSAQPQMMAKDADPDWEVVTIKPSAPSDKGDYMDMHGRHWTFERETVEEMLGIGYGVQKRQLAGEPDWARTDRWDVDGLSDTDGEPDLKQLQSMMRKVLAERFGLKLHNERRQMPVFALTVAKGGPKLTENTTDPNGTMDQNGASGNGWKSSRFSNATMRDLALILNFHVDRPVVDQTGLKARYDFRLKWLTDDSHANDPDAPPGIFTAIQEQLGLKLEPAKALADVVVIDKVERPGAN
jgi:uncharacterized protein (TIGR03435 family)